MPLFRNSGALSARVTGKLPSPMPTVLVVFFLNAVPPSTVDRRSGVDRDTGGQLGHDIVQDRRAGVLVHLDTHAGPGADDRVIDDPSEGHGGPLLPGDHLVTADPNPALAIAGQNVVGDRHAGHQASGIQFPRHADRPHMGSVARTVSRTGVGQNAELQCIGDGARLDQQLTLVAFDVAVALEVRFQQAESALRRKSAAR